MPRLDDIIFTLLWIVLFFGAGMLYRPIMPVCLVAATLLAVYCARLIFTRHAP